MKTLLKKIEAQYADELKIQIPLLEQQIDILRTKATEEIPGIRIASDGKVAGTINYADMKVLYLLVRHFQPKVIFEIGTWIGTSAMVMAEAIRKNGNNGVVYTCDTADCYLEQEHYRSIIKKITAFSDSALSELPIDTKVDFVFADGELTFKTIEKLNRKASMHMMIATHDYVLPAEKGVLNYLRLQLRSFGGYKLLSSRDISNVIKADTLIGIIYRDHGNNLISSFVSRIRNLCSVFLIGIKATAIRIYRKFSNYYK